jgi:hypothetical protein
MSHFIDSEPPCLGEATTEHICQDAITKEYNYILKNDKILLRDQKGSLW